VASTPPSASSTFTSPPPSISLHSWSFRERLPVSSPLLAWRNLRLSYRVTGPLSLILRPSAFERYTALFRFLFSLKRCHHALQHSFMFLSPLRQHARLEPYHAQLVSLRASLLFMISALHDYLFADIIEPSFALLVRNVQRETDFMSVRRHHDEHLIRVMTGCWLKDGVVSGAVGELFALCERAVAGMARDQREEGYESWVEDARVEWERLASFLWTVWSRKAGVLSSASLSSLLTRLDFNGYFTQLSIASGMKRLHAGDRAERREPLY